MRRRLAQFSVSKAVTGVGEAWLLVVYVGAWTVRQFDGLTGRLSPYLQVVNASIGTTNPREREVPRQYDQRHCGMPIWW
jgi:hypothetical protein